MQFTHSSLWKYVFVPIVDTKTHIVTVVGKYRIYKTGMCGEVGLLAG